MAASSQPKHEEVLPRQKIVPRNERVASLLQLGDYTPGRMRSAGLGPGLISVGARGRRRGYLGAE